jgi:hypothetical protein
MIPIGLVGCSADGCDGNDISRDQDEGQDDRPMTRNDQLLSRLRAIGYDSGELEIRVRAAESAIRDDRSRFATGDAGRLQWNWYLGQLSSEIGLERHRLARSARKPTRPGKMAPAPLLALLDSLCPRILDLKENSGSAVT